MTLDQRKRAVAYSVTIISAALLLWFLLNWIYFLRMNMGLLGLFPALFQPYTFSFANTPPLQLLQAAITLGITQLFGLMLSRIFRIDTDKFSAHLLAFPIGFGVSGIAFELLTMARLLYTPAVWLVWIVLLGGAFAAQRCESIHRFFAFPLFSIEEQEPDPHWKETFRALDWFGRFFVPAAMVLTLLICATTLWHAVFFPETYWDSLILYLGYARMTFFEHGFPFKAEAQVGIGLGANYPHLYPNFGAVASTMWGEWSSLHHRLAAPVAGCIACAIVFMTTWRLWKSAVVSAATVLLFRAIPNGIAYTTYASDYAFAILFIAAFLLLALLFVRRPTVGRLTAFTLIPAIAMHLNFLMGILWVPWLATLVAMMLCSERPDAARWKRIAAIFLVCCALGSTWNVRNWVLTGNPVYSFFPEVFTSSIRVNTEVLRSAEIEWFRNGDGIGRTAELFYDLEHNLRNSEGDPDFKRRVGFRHRLTASFLFWTGFDVIKADESTVKRSHFFDRLSHLLGLFENPHVRGGYMVQTLSNPHFYKMAPLFPGLFFPSLAVLIIYTAVSRSDKRMRIVLGVTALTALSLLAYMYFLADFYLYQIIGIIGPAAIISGFVLWLCARHRLLLYPACVVVLLQGMVPGLAFGLMNFKFFGEQPVWGEVYSAPNLDGFRNPGMREEIFYRLRFGADVDMWDYVNEKLKGETILTHENRHYVFDPSITFVHLDDWDMQQGYDLESAEAIRDFLHAHGLEYYLQTPNEFRHAVNRRLGMQKLLQAGYLEELYRAGDNVLYRIKD